MLENDALLYPFHERNHLDNTRMLPKTLAYSAFDGMIPHTIFEVRGMFDDNIFVDTRVMLDIP
jgi:hypothetical protein